MDFDDFEVEDLAIIGGTVGYFEEEAEEQKRIEREQDNEDPCNGDDYEELIP